jgi:hypothetical protein
MLHLTVPLSQPLSIIEALQIVQTQLQHAQDMQAKQVRADATLPGRIELKNKVVVLTAGTALIDCSTIGFAVTGLSMQPHIRTFFYHSQSPPFTPLIAHILFWTWPVDI